MNKNVNKLAERSISLLRFVIEVHEAGDSETSSIDDNLRRLWAGIHNVSQGKAVQHLAKHCKTEEGTELVSVEQ